MDMDIDHLADPSRTLGIVPFPLLSTSILTNKKQYI